MPPEIPVIAVSEFDAGGPDLLLDVREDEEWAAGRISEAVHIPMNQVPPRLAEIPTDRRVVVVCKVGGRSAQVTAWLRAQGYDAHNLDGGMLAWAVAHKPMVADADAEPYVA